MNLEMAHKIIEQEALPLILANPHLKFDVNDGIALRNIFFYNNSKIVMVQTYSGVITDTAGVIVWINCYIFKINHPKHGIAYYKIIHGDVDARTTYVFNMGIIVEPYSDLFVDWETVIEL